MDKSAVKFFDQKYMSFVRQSIMPSDFVPSGRRAFPYLIDASGCRFYPIQIDSQLPWPTKLELLTDFRRSRWTRGRIVRHAYHLIMWVDLSGYHVPPNARRHTLAPGPDASCYLHGAQESETNYFTMLMGVNQSCVWDCVTDNSKPITV